MSEHEFIIEDHSDSIRIDVFLSSCFEDMSRSYIQGIIEKDMVKVNGVNRKSNYKLKAGDKVNVIIPSPVGLNIEPEDLPLDIVYEDADVIVVNKPQGMVVHPASGLYNGTLVNALLFHCKDLSGINGITRPELFIELIKTLQGCW